MSDNQRRLFCQLLFVLMCALPTAVTGYWICHPQTATGWEQTLQAKLGLNTSIDSIETPGPYVTVLRGLEFTDPEVGSLFKAVEAKIEFGVDENIVTIPYRVQNLTNTGLACLVKIVNQHLIRSQDVEKPWRVQFLKDTVVSQQIANLKEAASLASGKFIPQFTMTETQIDIFRRVDGTHAEASFKVANSNAPDKSVVCAAAKTEKYGQYFGLNTESVRIPCWLVANTVPYVSSSLGDKATFAGRVDFLPDMSESQISIDGNFDEVDLQLSVGITALPERYGRIELVKCSFINGSTANWDGWLYQGSEKMRIAQSSLFNMTRQLAPNQAIGSALMERSKKLIARQPNGQPRLH